MQYTDKIAFNVDSKKILKIIASEIYDSPYAVIRENIQNAYDATLMRFGLNDARQNGHINIDIAPDKIIITDNGIGMSFEDLQNHFWRAGSSGKNDPITRAAGVIGNFGIGALANFGVCSKIRVETRSAKTNEYISSELNIDDLAINQDCVNVIERTITKDGFDIGTRISLFLQPTSHMDINDINSYISSYIRFLPVKIVINGNNVSQQSYEEVIVSNEFINNIKGLFSFEACGFTFDFELKYSKSNSISAICKNIKQGDTSIYGGLYLAQNHGPLMGYKSSFGLAPIPVGGIYRFGGYVNVPFLDVTAGRDAITMESIKIINNIISCLEKCISINISKYSICDNIPSFVQWVSDKGRIDLANNITINCLPGNRDIKLGDICNEPQTNKLYYTGNDKSIINSYLNADTLLLIPSTARYRKNIQILYLKNIKIEEIANNPRVTTIYQREAYTPSELFSTLTIQSILDEQYQMRNCELYVAELSNSATILPVLDKDVLKIYIQRGSEYLNIPQRYLESARDLYGLLMNDFVRNWIYPTIREYIPSAKKLSIDEMRKINEKNRELYKYKYSESGSIDEIMKNSTIIDKLINDSTSEYDWSHISMILQRKKGQRQTISARNVGEMAQVVEDLQAASAKRAESAIVTALHPLMPIDRRKIATDMKILVAPPDMSVINNFMLFLGLSDKVQRLHYQFFLLPHTTKIIWGGQRVICIFSQPDTGQNLYYDIELFSPLPPTVFYGGDYPTTTIITKDRIFIPIPKEIKEAFEVTSGSREFYVRYEILYSLIPYNE